MSSGKSKNFTTFTRHLSSFCFASHLRISSLDWFVSHFTWRIRLPKLVDNFRAYCVLRMIQNISGWTTAGASLAVLSAVSVLIIVSVRRVLQTVFVFWILSTTIVMLRFWIRQWIILPVVIVVTSLLITTLSTLKIFHIVRGHRRQISQQHQSLQFNTVKVEKSVENLLWPYFMSMVCSLFSTFHFWWQY